MSGISFRISPDIFPNDLSGEHLRTIFPDFFRVIFLYLPVRIIRKTACPAADSIVIRLPGSNGPNLSKKPYRDNMSFKISPGRKTVVFSALLLLILAAVSFSGCLDKTPTAQDGDTVKVHYILTVDGNVRESSYDRGTPLEFTIGAGQMIKGFNDAVIGMKVGEKKKVDIPPENAYGVHRDEMVDVIPLEQMEAQLGSAPEVGEQLYGLVGGSYRAGTVTDVSNGNVTVDFNHALAGKTLTFEIELVELTPAATETPAAAQ